MLKKRLVGVITVKDGWAVQSFGYQRHLPLGRPECLAENLDRWGADEILVLSIDRSRRGLGPDLELLRRLGVLGLSTPLTYGGGIRSVAEAGAVIQCGADRLCVDALLHSQPDVVRAISELVGAQAVIGVLPVARGAGGLRLRHHLSGQDAPLSSQHLELFAARVASEALVVDWRHEGQRDSFDTQLLEGFPLAGVPLIAFGGISEPVQLEALFRNERVAAVGVGNFLAYREHAIQSLKLRSGVGSVRPAHFMGGP